jgi:hypothetical protein
MARRFRDHRRRRPRGRLHRPGRRRRRPGRSPPFHPKSPVLSSRPRGFTGFGFGPYYSWLLPGLRGREKREFFNKACGGLILGCGLGGAMLGLALAGPIGAAIGFGVGLGVGGTIAEKGRFYRG